MTGGSGGFVGGQKPKITIEQAIRRNVKIMSIKAEIEILKKHPPVMVKEAEFYLLPEDYEAMIANRQQRIRNLENNVGLDAESHTEKLIKEAGWKK